MVWDTMSHWGNTNNKGQGLSQLGIPPWKGVGVSQAYTWCLPRSSRSVGSVSSFQSSPVPLSSSPSSFFSFSTVWAKFVVALAYRLHTQAMPVTVRQVFSPSCSFFFFLLPPGIINKGIIQGFESHKAQLPVVCLAHAQFNTTGSLPSFLPPCQSFLLLPSSSCPIGMVNTTHNKLTTSLPFPAHRSGSFRPSTMAPFQVRSSVRHSTHSFTNFHNKSAHHHPP